MGLFIGSVTFALVLSFFCSISEAAVLSLTPGEVANIQRRHYRIGKIWEKFKAAIDRPIVVILVLNTIANTIGATIAGAQFEKTWGGQGVIWFGITFTLSILFFSEIIPKTLGVTYRRQLAVFLAPPLDYLVTIFRPFIYLAGWFSRPFTRSKSPTKSLALEELRALAAYARFSKEIGTYQEKIITEASRLSQKTAEEIMIPVDEIISFSNTQSMEDMITRAHLEPHTRFPIISQNDINQILGYVNFKELLFLARNNPSNPTVQGIIRPVRFIVPDKQLSKLLRSFIEEHIHIAIVQDSNGKTLGIITLEDIVEEFLGEIEDEFDRLPKMTHSLAGGTWMVGGGIPLRELAQRIQKPLEPFPGTLSEWLLQKAQKPLRPGDRVTFGDLDFITRRVRRGKVFEVTILPHGIVPPPHLPKAIN